MKKRSGQSVLEYAIVISLVGAACTAMAVYVSRATNSKMIAITQQISPVQNRTTAALSASGSGGWWEYFG